MKQVLLILSFLPCLLSAQSSIYTNDMDYVLGDVKQAFIQDKISNPTQVQMLLEGFKAMQVNGIRVPIITDAEVPNEQALSYFCKQAVEAGFKIFANPAQSSGGQRLACEVLDSEGLVSVYDDDDATQTLIDRILDFESQIECTWICPFNEDGKAGAAFSASQMNTIFSTLAASDMDAELIGPCVWGIPASIQVLQNTDIKNYIGIATTHNLGFNHDSWPDFIAEAESKNLPVWDSEVNHTRKYEDEMTRLEAALYYEVDGLVLYNSWNFIAYNGDGSINSTAQTWMSLYLKPTAIQAVEDESDLFDVYSGASSFTISLMEPFIPNDITVLDMNGRVIRQLTSNGVQDLEVDDLRPGVYVLVLSAAGELQREKVVVY